MDGGDQNATEVCARAHRFAFGVKGIGDTTSRSTRWVMTVDVVEEEDWNGGQPVHACVPRVSWVWTALV
jgi:hypothetical protein